MVTSFCVLPHHLVEPGPEMQAAYTMLKPGGWLVLQLPDNGTLRLAGKAYILAAGRVPAAASTMDPRKPVWPGRSSVCLQPNQYYRVPGEDRVCQDSNRTLLSGTRFHLGAIPIGKAFHKTGGIRRRALLAAPEPNKWIAKPHDCVCEEAIETALARCWAKSPLLRPTETPRVDGTTHSRRRAHNRGLTPQE